jgi:putative restriction endonuclease
MANLQPHFGEVAGVVAGKRFHRRDDLRRSGLHRQPGRGIDASPEGACAVVFAGGYSDDSWDPREAWYTGEGGQDTRGRQVRDQKLVRGNRALKVSLDSGKPVRVIRKIDKGIGDFEYVYEGLYEVSEYRYDASKDGPKVFRFLLRKKS